MKRAIIVHCWGGSPRYAWYPWLKDKLEDEGYEVIVPAMPNTEHPQLGEWLPTLIEQIGEPDTDLLLIGHSLGCATIMRYLETLNKDQFVGQVIFVAGFAASLSLEPIDNFFISPINLDQIKSKSVDGFVVVQSDNDPYVPMNMAEQLKDKLNATLFIKHAAGHMSGPLNEAETCTELPEVLRNVHFGIRP